MTPEQQRAVELLGRGFSQPEVARLVGRSARTIRNWQRDVAGFCEAVPAARPRRATRQRSPGYASAR